MWDYFLTLFSRGLYFCLATCIGSHAWGTASTDRASQCRGSGSRVLRRFGHSRGRRALLLGWKYGYMSVITSHCIDLSAEDVLQGRKTCLAWSSIFSQIVSQI